jgi:glycosyltransferase involved in cell wall biosynthesis
MSAKNLSTSLASLNQKITKSINELLETLSTPKLRVAIISYYYEAPTISGVGVHAKDLAEHLLKNGCEVHVFCKSSADFPYKDRGVTVHPVKEIAIPIDDQVSRKRLLYDFFESEVIKEFIRENTRHRFDIVHTHGSLTKAAFTIKKIFGIRWVHTFHAIEKMRAEKLSEEEKHFEDLVSWIESTTNYCDGAIFVSKTLMDEVTGHYTLKSKRVIPNGVDFKLFHATPIKNKNVLFIGRFSEEKGVEYLPEIVSEVMSVEGATFTALCPYNTLGQKLAEIRKALQIQQNLYKGRIKIIEKEQMHERIVKLYSDCQIYIQPSKYESFGLCVLEAMASARPVIAFNVGGIPEVLGDTGLLVNSKEELLSGIRELLMDDARCTFIGNRANERAKEFSWDLVAEKTIEYYHEVMQ